MASQLKPTGISKITKHQKKSLQTCHKNTPQIITRKTLENIVIGDPPEHAE